jgi:hypothetical protein
VRNRSQSKNPVTGNWTKRDTATGKFLDVKEDANDSPFKNVRKEKATKKSPPKRLFPAPKEYIIFHQLSKDPATIRQCFEKTLAAAIKRAKTEIAAGVFDEAESSVLSPKGVLLSRFLMTRGGIIMVYKAGKL